jgi:hypothetical protein
MWKIKKTNYSMGFPVTSLKKASDKPCCTSIGKKSSRGVNSQKEGDGERNGRNGTGQFLERKLTRMEGPGEPPGRRRYRKFYQSVVELVFSFIIHESGKADMQRERNAKTRFQYLGLTF